jgi:hypothetical protein
MKKRRKRNTSRSAQPPKSDSPDNKEDKTIAEPERELCPSDQSKSGNGAEEEGSLFREAMAGVEPLQSNKVKARAPGPLSKPSRRPLLEGELEAYAQLVDLVSGEGSFDIEYTDEYIEGAVSRGTGGGGALHTFQCDQGAAMRADHSRARTQFARSDSYP